MVLGDEFTPTTVQYMYDDKQRTNSVQINWGKYFDIFNSREELNDCNYIDYHDEGLLKP